MNDGNNDDNEVDNSYASNEDDDNDDNELDDDENDDNEDGGNEAVQNAFEGDESNLVPSLARWKKTKQKKHCHWLSVLLCLASLPHWNHENVVTLMRLYWMGVLKKGFIDWAKLLLHYSGLTFAIASYM